MLSDCFRALSSSEYVFQVGLMLSRGAEAVRLCITIGSVERAVEYLAGVGWPCSEADVLGVLEPIASLVDRVYLDIDVGETVHRKIGLECYFDGTSNPGPSQGGAFSWILLSGMACVRPTSATRCWRIRATSARTRKVYPGRERCRASHLLGGRSLSIFIRSLHHVKVVYQPGEGLEAKAYLAVNHHWHTPALRG